LRPVRRKADLAAISAIETACFPEDAFTEEMLDEWLKARNSRCRVAMENGKMIGFVIYEVQRHSLYIGDVAVVPESRGKGLGRRLTELVLRAARRLDKAKVHLHVRPSNKGAVACYEHAGFAITRIVPHYFGNEDAYMMVHKLQRARAIA
jgi:ribosomal-protein-alanine N-acetyltransferase